jgi:hypothetical protein
MKFAYYKNLTERQRRIYDRSDAAGPVRVPEANGLAPLVAALEASLRRDDRRATEAAVQRLVDVLLYRLRVPLVEMRVLPVRPSNRREELHGLYEFGGRRQRPRITLWMRTAQRRQVVAFRTFLRTSLHEVVHHLDYQLLHLADSYHTEGFYKRAESLYRQLVPEPRVAGAPEHAAAPAPPLAPVAVLAGTPMLADSPALAAPPRGTRRAPRSSGGAASPGDGARPPARAARPPASRPRAADSQPLLPFLE